MELLAMDLFHPQAVAPRRRGGGDGWGLWRPMTDPAWAASLSRWQPHATVEHDEAAKEMAVRVETPGFPRDRLSVELSDDRRMLTVSGSMRKAEPAPADGTADGAAATSGRGGGEAAQTVFSSFEERHFTQSFRLPRDADVEAIKADYEHGVLCVRVPTKGPEALPQKRNIAIADK